MKEYIQYYYHLVINDLRLVRGRYFFHDQKYHYMLETVYFPPNILENIAQLNEVLRTYSEFYHQIVKNVQGSIWTLIDRKAYVLLKLSSISDKKIHLSDLKMVWSISIPRNKNFTHTHFPWFPLWEEKIDYFENYPAREKEYFIGDSGLLDLFIGLGENAISYLKETLKEVRSFDDLPLVPSHRRVSRQMSLIDFYDPLGLILDLRVRDIAEYFKDSFWNSDYDLREMELFLSQARFSKIEAQLFFSRLLFPSFYFDYLEQKELPKHLDSRVEEFLFFITDIYSYLREQYFIEEIKWLNAGVR